jgi:hypothetical protein
MKKSDFKYLAAFLACVLACLFFLSWAMQTIWIASFPDQDSSKYAVWFYIEFAAGVGFAIGAIWIGWRWWRSGKKAKK